jgi:hypothetical protein
VSEGCRAQALCVPRVHPSRRAVEKILSDIYLTGVCSTSHHVVQLELQRKTDPRLVYSLMTRAAVERRASRLAHRTSKVCETCIRYIFHTAVPSAVYPARRMHGCTRSASRDADAHGGRDGHAEVGEGKRSEGSNENSQQSR